MEGAQSPAHLMQSATEEEDPDVLEVTAEEESLSPVGTSFGIEKGDRQVVAPLDEIVVERHDLNFIDSLCEMPRVVDSGEDSSTSASRHKEGAIGGRCTSARCDT